MTKPPQGRRPTKDTPAHSPSDVWNRLGAYQKALERIVANTECIKGTGACAHCIAKTTLYSWGQST